MPSLAGKSSASYSTSPQEQDMEEQQPRSWMRRIGHGVGKRLGLVHDRQLLSNTHEIIPPRISSWDELSSVGVIGRVLHMDGVGPAADDEALLLEIEAGERVSLSSVKPQFSYPPICNTIPFPLLPFDKTDQTILALISMVRETSRDLVIHQGMSGSSAQELLDVFETPKSMEDSVTTAESFLRRGVPGSAIQKAYAYSRMEDAHRRGELERFCDVAVRVSNNATADQLYAVLSSPAIDERLKIVLELLQTELKLLRTQVCRMLTYDDDR